MRWLLLLLALGIAQAQSVVLIRDGAALVQLLDAAQSQIVLQVPALRGNPALANALGRAVAVRGVEVWVLAGQQGAQRSDSYLPWLGLHAFGGKYPNLHLRVSGEPLEAFLIVDGRFVVRGRLLWQEVNPLSNQPTVGSADGAEASRYLARFRAAYSAGKALDWPQRR